MSRLIQITNMKKRKIYFSRSTTTHNFYDDIKYSLEQYDGEFQGEGEGRNP